MIEWIDSHNILYSAICGTDYSFFGIISWVFRSSGKLPDQFRCPSVAETSLRNVVVVVLFLLALLLWIMVAYVIL